ncbi:hypothetical protein FRC09_014024 [Ceratobasidium sp. 395]|nr:hypothetical protein FRC09_014024 [Ceratobasidium sp. 395]
MTLAAPPLALPSPELLSATSITVDVQVEKTSTHLLAIRQVAKSAVLPTSNEASPVGTSACILESIHAMIARYNCGWKIPPKHLKSRVPPLGERVVVTGTTGALGSYLLAHLLENDRVEKVWAMNRRSREVEQRQRASFIDKGLDVGLLKSNKLVLVEANLEAEDLGMKAELFDEIRSTATIIIHNAWQVNFNFTLEQFEPSIKGVRNLIDLAFGSTAPTGLPRFVFTSSFSAAGFGKPGHYLMEEYLTPEDAATAIGYGQSKFVTEKLLESARDAGLETCVVRLGQLTGDVDSGMLTWGGRARILDTTRNRISLHSRHLYFPRRCNTASHSPLTSLSDTMVAYVYYVRRRPQNSERVHAYTPDSAFQ